MSTSGVFETIYDDLVFVSEMPPNQDQFFHLHHDLGSSFISTTVIIQTWPLHGDIQFERDDKVRITQNILVRI